MAAISRTESSQGTKRKEMEPEASPAVRSSAEVSRRILRRTVTKVYTPPDLSALAARVQPVETSPPIGELDIELRDPDLFLTQQALNDLARIRYARKAISAQEKLAKQTRCAAIDPCGDKRKNWEVLKGQLFQLIQKKKILWSEEWTKEGGIDAPVPCLPVKRLTDEFENRAPAPLEEPLEKPLEIGSGQSRGARPYQEDRVIENYRIRFGSQERGSFEGSLSAILDGHGDGGAAVEHVADRLGRDFEVILQDAFNRSKGPLDEIVPDSFCRLTEWLAHSCRERAKRLGLQRGGTTLSASLQIKSAIWVANVGDSRVVLVGPTRTVPVSEDGSLEKEDTERFRRTHRRLGNLLLGGVPSRVAGPHHQQGDPKLTVGRAIGAHPWMPCIPKITKLVASRKANDLSAGKLYYRPGELLVFATDGVTGSLTTEEIGTVVRVARKRGYSLPEIAKTTVNLVALVPGNDNASLILRRLDV